MSLKDILQESQKEMIKEAIIGTGLKLMGRVGKVIVRNPMKTVTFGFGASDIGQRAANMTDAASGARNIAANVGRINL